MNSLVFAIGLKDEVKGTGFFAEAVNLSRAPGTGLLGAYQSDAAEAVVRNMLALIALAGLLSIGGDLDAIRQQAR